MQKIGINSLLGVSSGSFNEPRVVIFEWNLQKNKKPSILVGKGVTFDTGGISLKPASGMEEMIFDMGGSAVVVGSMINAALNKYNQSLVGIIGLVENMTDGKAQRPGDIVRSLSGQTIEVLNTDAEGRLVLADILTYVQRKYKPMEIIDFATLTGAIMIALGTYKAGLFSNNDMLANKIFRSGEVTKENVWRLPLNEEYDKEFLILVFREHLDFNVKFEPLKILPSKDKERRFSPIDRTLRRELKAKFTNYWFDTTSYKNLIDLRIKYELRSSIKAFDIKIKEFNKYGKIKIKDITVEYFEVDHKPVKLAYGFNFLNKNKKITRYNE